MTDLIKPIPINDAHLDRLRGAIDVAEGRATAFCVHPEILAEIATRAEMRLAVLPQRLWSGTKVTYLPAGPWARSYNGGRSVKATQVTLVRRSRDWVLTSVSRQWQHNGKRERLDVTLPAKVSPEVLNRYLAAASGLTLNSSTVEAA
ncbi:hypothetical protein [Tsukamurella pseudospumae]|uniref:Uncharacterized protein n=1 Tax=Tsukamurella pseudospumae TaxID=239498 RepID=A0A138AE94_9ACTN|nr:hypothetical protein [Tsukamurella pseudospumae]KXP08788.1 hypothetical protein AXK60_08980 [Tsukamurella pseudospumae]